MLVLALRQQRSGLRVSTSIGERVQTCWVPFWMGEAFDRLSFTHAFAEELEYSNVMYLNVVLEPNSS